MFIVQLSINLRLVRHNTSNKNISGVCKYPYRTRNPLKWYLMGGEIANK